MDFCVNVTVEVDQVGNGLLIHTPVPIQLVRRGGAWRAECEAPVFRARACETMEQAIVAGAEQAAAELQAAVEDRPLIVGRITPDNIPTGMF